MSENCAHAAVVVPRAARSADAAGGRPGRAPAVVRGNVSGTFYVTMPIRVPRGADPVRFGRELVAVIEGNTRELVGTAIAILGATLLK